MRSYGGEEAIIPLLEEMLRCDIPNECDTNDDRMWHSEVYWNDINMMFPIGHVNA